MTKNLEIFLRFVSITLANMFGGLWASKSMGFIDDAVLLVGAVLGWYLATQVLTKKISNNI